MESVLHEEIGEQPAVVAGLLAAEAASIRAIGEQLAQHSIQYVLIAARGSSDNAARYAQYLFGMINGLTVALATPSLFGAYGHPPRLQGALVIGISQSGQSPDIVHVLEEARRQGAPTIALTNDPHSPLAAAAEHCIALHAGTERSIAATKTYTTQLAALALLSLSISPAFAATTSMDAVPAAMRLALESEEQARDAAQRLAQSDRCVVLGRGFNYATACEIALKIKELTYVVAEPYSSADFEHGPIAMIERGFPVVMVVVGETMRAEMLALADRLRARGAALVVLGDDEQFRHSDDGWIAVPATLPEWLTPCVAVLPGQLLAYHLAQLRGLNPDRPRALNKVTLTN
ncbi:MAG: SIS domain-containing protein [Herpetosiphonaceae bacterium]|nr:SIS domain-containing protein [Herpetosiphonaceae bacterium]